MNIEKVKEALKANLEALCSLDKNQFGDVIIDGIPSHPVTVELVGRTREAIAELEKPAGDDAISLVDSWVLDHCGKYESAKTATDDLIPRIQQYAESYHAKQCARCMSELDDVDRAAPRFQESRSGVTTDVDK